MPVTHEPADAFEFDIAPASTWSIRVAGFNPHTERETESLLAVGNGLVGVRGSLEETAQESRPATLFAGIFDSLPKNSVSIKAESAALVVAPNWLKLSIWIDGEPLTIKRGEALEHERILDLRQAILFRRWRHRLPSGRVVRLKTLRAALLPDRHALIQRVWLTVEDSDAQVRLRAELNGDGTSGLTFDNPAKSVLAGRTQNSEFQLAIAQVGRIRNDGIIEGKYDQRLGAIADTWEWRAKRDRVYSFERLAVWSTSRQTEDPTGRAARRLRSLSARDTEALLDKHRKAWAEHWVTSDIRIEGDEWTERALRFAAYHLMSCGEPEEERISIGARGLSGTGYRGHVFWDTEIYMLPFFLFTWPAAARALLMYRYHTLPLARAKASALGYRGALYAWESVAGYEATPTKGRGANGETVEIQTGRFAHHIAADVAYAVHQYFRATGDESFLAEAGTEIAIETARFWASRVAMESDGQYHICRVVPPDEYHELVDDSAFTNSMARFNLEFAHSAADWMEKHDPERWRALASRMGVAPEETKRWLEIAAKLANTECRGLIEEFRGYFKLEDLDLKTVEPRTAALPVLRGHDATAKTQVVKQADVVLLCHLLADRFDTETIARNFDYYEPRCDFGSSLGPSIYALIAARLGRLDQARTYLRRAASIDLDDAMGNSAQGIHSANAGGVWQAAIMGFAGFRLTDDSLRFDPHLLPEWKSLSFTILYRGCRLEVTLRHAPSPCEFALVAGDGVWVEMSGHERKRLTPAERKLVV